MGPKFSLWIEYMNQKLMILSASPGTESSYMILWVQNYTSQEEKFRAQNKQLGIPTFGGKKIKYYTSDGKPVYG